MSEGRGTSCASPLPPLLPASACSGLCPATAKPSASCFTGFRCSYAAKYTKASLKGQGAPDLLDQPSSRSNAPLVLAVAGIH